MRLTIKVKLLPTAEQKAALIKTIEIFNSACNHISEVAWKEKKFGQVGLHHLCYRYVRDTYKLSAQMTVRAIGKVAESYRAEKRNQHRFKKHSSLVYDERILSFKRLDTVSILSLEGRFKIPILCGSYAQLHRRMLRGQADLLYRKGNLFLCLCIEVPDGTPFTPRGALGIDMGIVNLAVTSDGKIFSSTETDAVRKRTTKFKAKLQHRGSKNAKRHLIKYSGKERRFKCLINHRISKAIISTALKTQRAVALEDLKGFRSPVRKGQREIFGKWAFDELRRFIEYKAALAGVPVVIVDPRHTSQTCSACGHVSKSNRKSQALFSCTSCGETLNADINAARNIGRLAAVNQPSLISVRALSLNAPPPGTESPGL